MRLLGVVYSFFPVMAEVTLNPEVLCEFYLWLGLLVGFSWLWVIWGLVWLVWFGSGGWFAFTACLGCVYSGSLNAFSVLLWVFALFDGLG